MLLQSASARAFEWRRVIRAACLILLATPLLASRARAFCRESLESQSSGPCDASPGVPFLYWKRNCMTYKFNAQFFSVITGLDEAHTRQAFDASFATWADVQT